MAKSDIDVRLRLRDARRFQADAKRSKQSLQGFSGTVQGIGRGMQATGARMSGFGKNLSRSVTLPIVGAGIAAFKMHADFEDSMSKITGLVGISEKQVGAWGDDILGMAKNLPQSPKELADAMFFITSAGLRGQTALDALNASARASAGGLGETKSVADAVTSAMNAYGKDVLSAGRATDILTAAVKEGKLEASALAPVIGSVLPMAQAAGVGFEEVAGAIALMSKAGTNAARGATQVTAILGTFAKPTVKSVAALDEMGMSLGGVRKMLANKGLAATLETLRKRAKDAGVDLSEVFGNKRALTGVLQMTKSTKETTSVMDGVRKSAGMTDKAFKAASKTAKFQMASALSSLQVTAIQLGAALGPTIVPMIKKAGSFIGKLGEKFQDLSPTMKKVVGGALLFAAAIGPVMWILGGITGGIGTLLIAMVKLGKAYKTLRGLMLLTRLQLVALAVWQAVVTAATTAQTVAQWALNVAMRANPIVAVVTLLIALGVAFVLAYKKVGWFRSAVQAVWNFIKTHWKKIVMLLAGPMGFAVVKIIEHWGQIKAAATATWQWVRNAFSNLVGWFKSLPGKIAAAASGIFSPFKEAAKTAFNGVASLWNNTVGKLSFKLPGWIPKIGGKGFSMPKIPELAQGGLVQGFGSFISGERGPEMNTITPQGVVVQPLGVAMAGPGGAAPSAAALPDSFPLRTSIYLDSRMVGEGVGRATRDRKARE